MRAASEDAAAIETMEPGVDDEGADPGSWGHVSCCGHCQPLLVLVAPTVHHLSKTTLQSAKVSTASVHFGCGRLISS